MYTLQVLAFPLQTFLEYVNELLKYSIPHVKMYANT